MTTVNEDYNDNTKVRMNLFFEVFSSFVLLTNSMIRLIHNWIDVPSSLHAHEQLRLCFYVLVRYFVVLDIHLWKIY